MRCKLLIPRNTRLVATPCIEFGGPEITFECGSRSKTSMKGPRFLHDFLLPCQTRGPEQLSGTSRRYEKKAVKKARIDFNHVSRESGPTRIEELTSGLPYKPKIGIRTTRMPLSTLPVEPST